MLRQQRAALWMAVLALAAVGSAHALEITSYTVDSGGGESVSARYRLQGTVGQPDAHPSLSARFSVDGGFWPASESSPQTDPVFANSFE